MEKTTAQRSNCNGRLCGYYAGSSGIACDNGDGSCRMAVFLEAEESGFHDRQLVEATKAIKEILQKIPADPKGRELSLIHTNMGILLAWVSHDGGAISESAVSSKNDDATIAAALKLKM